MSEKRPAAPRPARPETMQILIGCDARTAARSAEEVLARIPWEGRRLDPRTTTAEKFLGWIS